jgi:hypothetical protein
MEFTWVSSAAFYYDNNDNAHHLTVVPQPIDWKLMADSNVARVRQGVDEIFVNVTGKGMCSHRYVNRREFSQDGVRYTVWDHCNGKFKQIVARHLSTISVRVKLEVEYERESIYVKMRSVGGAVIHEDVYKSSQVITYGWVGYRVLEHLMMETGASRFTKVDVLKGNNIMTSNVRLWSPKWAAKESKKPLRRVAGKQKPLLQRTLAMYFTKRAVQ